MKPPIDKDYFRHLRELVQLEEREEFEQVRSEFTNLTSEEREVRGKALLSLFISEITYSPAGHLLVSFELRPARPLPMFTLEVGDIVSIAMTPAVTDEYPQGTVYTKSLDTITVAFNEDKSQWIEELEENGYNDIRFELHRSVNKATFRRMLETLDAVLQTQNTRLAVFRDISLKTRKAMSDDADLRVSWLDMSLNQSQKLAVERCLRAKDVALVHGPPGTGKTTALVEFIRQSLLRKKSIFVTAPSNTACDNLLERLVNKNVNVLRLGHPARVSDHLRDHTLDFKLALHPVAKEVEKAEAEMRRLKNRQDRYRDRRSPGFENEKELRRDISLMKQEIKNLKKEVYTRVMKETEVVVGTPTSIMDRSIRERTFDVVVIDEATQATEPMAWIPMSHCEKVVMAGDHYQLPPTVRSKEADEKGLGVTLFERFHEILSQDFKTLLDQQYRMNEKIMGFSSREFYENKLVADLTVRHQVLAELKGVKDCPDTREPLLYIDTAGKGFEEKLELGSESRYNPEEGDVVLEQLQKMLDLGVPPAEIAVICPYSAQVRYLAGKFSLPDLEIDSVDGFQGREKELVIVSLVRSNLAGHMGFLNDTRRMNVAMTRARRKLIVVGDSATLSSLPFYRDFIKYSEEAGAYKTAWELE